MLTSEVIVVQMLDRRAFHYFVEDVDLKLPQPKLSVEMSPAWTAMR